MRISYEQVYSDWQYLWDTYGPAEDMTGGYVDQDDLYLLLSNPSKKTATKCLKQQIEYWFNVGPAASCGLLPRPSDNDPLLVEIAERYNCEWDFARLLENS